MPCQSLRKRETKITGLPTAKRLTFSDKNRVSHLPDITFRQLHFAKLDLKEFVLEFFQGPHEAFVLFSLFQLMSPQYMVCEPNVGALT